MVDIKISELTEITSADQDDIVAIVTDVGGGTLATRKVKIKNLADGIPAAIPAYTVLVLGNNQVWSVGTGRFFLTILDDDLDNMELKTVRMACIVPSTSGKPSMQIARGRRASPTSAPSYNNMLSTVISIDANEYTSLDAGVNHVIDTNFNDVSVGDILRFDITVAGTGAKGCQLDLIFGEP